MGAINKKYKKIATVSLVCIVILLFSLLTWKLTNKNRGASDTIFLYYYNPDLDTEGGSIECSEKGLVAVSRKPLADSSLEGRIFDTITLLLQGVITGNEKSSGITTEFPLQGVSLSSLVLKDGVLTLAFNDPNNKLTGGACRTTILWKQIERTALQFSDVKEVRFLPEDIFQP